MIIVKLTGGLGNQLFQYAYGKAFSMKNKDSLIIDTSWYKGRIDRRYMLDSFNIDNRIISSRFISWMLKKILKDKYLEGLWQGDKYFKEVEDTIRNDFTFKYQISEYNKKILENIISKNSISIHLRGTDYIIGKKSNFHGVCSKEYYKKAITKIRELLPSPHFFIFSDDIEWAKNYIQLPEPFTIVSTGKNVAWEELVLMSSSKHNIIANSTFSWWAAWLNNNKDKIIIAPKKWFNDDSVEISNLIPENWIKI